MVKKSSAKGLSLIEVLISIIIMGIIVTAMFPFFVRIQQKQVLASNVSVLFQGALASFETRRLHTLSRNYNNNTATGNPATGSNAGTNTGTSVQVATLYESIRNEIGYYAMSDKEIMPFAVSHVVNGPAIDWIYGNFITCHNVTNNTVYTYRTADRIPIYSNNPRLGYHRTFLFSSELVCFVSLTEKECKDKLGSGFVSSNSTAVSSVIKAANDTGFGRYRNAYTHTGNTSISNATSAVFTGQSTVITARNTILKLTATFKDRRLFYIRTHHVSGIYEWPDERTGHYSA